MGFHPLLQGEFNSHPQLSHTNRQLSACFLKSTIPLLRIYFILLLVIRLAYLQISVNFLFFRQIPQKLIEQLV